MIKNPYRQFRIQSENLMAHEQAGVVHIKAHSVSEMNVGIGVVRSRILNRLGADESSTRRDRKLIYGCPTTEVLRPSAGNENQNWHHENCEAFSRHLSSGVIEQCNFCALKISTGRLMAEIRYPLVPRV